MNRFAKAFVTAGILVASMFVAESAQAAPTVSVSSTPSSGTLTVGQSVTLTISFSEPVYLNGFPTITLETGPTDRTVYCNGTNSETLVPSGPFPSLTCTYTVQVGDRSTDLDYQSSGAILFNQAGQKISLTPGGSALNLTLPVPGSAGSLSRNSSIVIMVMVKQNSGKVLVLPYRDFTRS